MNKSNNIEMKTGTGEDKMKTYLLPAAVALVHIVAVGGFFLVGGCGTTAPDVPEPAPAPVMPPVAEPEVRQLPPARPPLRPPVRPEPDRTPAIELRTHVVREGEMLSQIAARHGVTVRELVEINNLKDADVIHVGQELVLPPHAAPVEGRPERPRPERREPDVTEPGKEYEVRSGDTLSGIAVRHGTTTSALMRLNNISDPNMIYEGQKLRIPGEAVSREPVEERIDEDEVEVPRVREPIGVEEPQRLGDVTVREDEPEEKPYPYTVREGESLMDIAKDFVVSPQRIMELNEITDPARIKPGQILLIPPGDL